MLPQPKASSNALARYALPRRRLVLLGLLLAALVATGRSAAAGPELSLENLDGLPSPDWLSFNRIENKFSSTAHHNQAVLRVRNSGTAPLTISQLPITGPWQLNPSPALPANIAAGAALDLPLLFNAGSGDFHQGTLRIVSNDADEANLPIQLGGFWQTQSENGQEPGLGHVLRVFGYATVIAAPGDRLNRQGLVDAVGDEVLSPYWRRADPARPVAVRQLAAFHGCCTAPNEAARMYWHNKGSTARTTLFSHAAADSQSILPRRGDATGLPLAEPAAATFNPGGLFGFNVDGEWSDPGLNDQTQDQANGCTGPCGHHVRAWRLRDRAGVIVPNAYVIGGDYNGVNYDYNDNIYLIENVAPEVAPPTPSPAQALYRLDVSGTRDYLDSNGNWWRPDTGFFTPASAPIEGQPPVDITPTRDDVLYSSYRGNVGNVPQSQRVLTYNLPVGGNGTYFVRLYFAERFHTAANRRVQDVLAEGSILSGFENLDIFARAGGRNRSYTPSAVPVQVSDGALTLAFHADINYPAVSGIEVYCPGSCPGAPPSPSPSPGASPTPSPVPPGPPTPSPVPSPRPSPGQPLPRRGWLPMAQR